MLIHLVSGPRNISTALMYAFAQRHDTVVLDEPFYAHYLTQTGLPHPGRAEVLASQSADATEVMQQIQALEKQQEVVFVKNMGHHLSGLDWQTLAEWTTVFLVRDPAQMLFSYQKVIENASLDDLGLAQQEAFRAYLQEAGKPYAVLEGNEVRKNPEGVLNTLCQQIHLPFEKAMLHWPAGPKTYDGSWAPYWYANVHASTRFSPPDTKEIHLDSTSQAVLAQALPYYKNFQELSIKA
ncbi:sulfotransferase family protein [Cytophagales bacterium LB-30]|uniref:Sulfotransferase family protein n=1 Tax=Shiella aurantiaca TaxID=3058365 RepID=A0ABT8F8P1_9BACT|nr:sulfotransferase family protein [Shiella aurantiaca]MDN4166846.1 sulfotransferase family protein [Shiella aurantiaca]